MIDELALLRLFQITDSAIPIGTISHSFGLETLVEDGLVTPASFEQYLHDYIEESGGLDAFFCRAAYQLPPLTGAQFGNSWMRLNAEISARKYARESRQASLTLGRRFLRLAAEWLGAPEIEILPESDSHHVAAFSVIARMIGVDQKRATLAWLHQSAMTQVSTAQRLMPLGQNSASAILWRLKPLLLDVAQRDLTGESFTPLLETAGMRHPKLRVRLFIS